MSALEPHRAEAMRQLLERTRDPAVHRLVRAHLEGAFTRAELLSDRRVAQEMSAWYREEIDAAYAAGYRPEMLAEVIDELRRDSDQL